MAQDVTWQVGLLPSEKDLNKVFKIHKLLASLWNFLLTTVYYGSFFNIR